MIPEAGESMSYDLRAVSSSANPVRGGEKRKRENARARAREKSVVCH